MSESEVDLMISDAPFVDLMPYEDHATMVLVRGEVPTQEQNAWMVSHPLLEHQKICTHQWEESKDVPLERRSCSYYRTKTRITSRISCDIGENPVKHWAKNGLKCKL